MDHQNLTPVRMNGSFFIDVVVITYCETNGNLVKLIGSLSVFLKLIF